MPDWKKNVPVKNAQQKLTIENVQIIEQDPIYVYSEYVGIFLKPTVGLKTIVQKNATLGIINVLGMMCKVISPVMGIVVVHYTPGHIVEYGQKIFKILEVREKRGVGSCNPPHPLSSTQICNSVTSMWKIVNFVRNDNTILELGMQYCLQHYLS